MLFDTESTVSSMFMSAFSEENNKNDKICKKFFNTHRFMNYKLNKNLYGSGSYTVDSFSI